jgi:hypothetical protein
MEKNSQQVSFRGLLKQPLTETSNGTSDASLSGFIAHSNMKFEKRDEDLCLPPDSGKLLQRQGGKLRKSHPLVYTAVFQKEGQVTRNASFIRYPSRSKTNLIM